MDLDSASSATSESFPTQRVTMDLDSASSSTSESFPNQRVTMNLDSASSATSKFSRKQRLTRGAIATHACDTCRSRKHRCDEQRPRCGLCQRTNLECRYQESKPIKKDKTLLEILDQLKSLEGKVDRIPTQRCMQPGFPPPQPSPASQPSFDGEDDDTGSYSVSSHRQSQQPIPSSIGRNQPYRYASAAYKMLAWPAIQHLLLQALPSDIGDLTSLGQEGSAFIAQMQGGIPTLPVDEVMQHRPFVGTRSQATGTSGESRITFPRLTHDLMHKLATAYFDTFNFIYPFMDRKNFISDTLTKVHTEGFNSNTESVIALLVFALGELAIEGARGNPIEVYKGRPSGIRGGIASKPPGLALFNEARKRIGFVLTDCHLENVQIYSLAALYYESCTRHTDFWRLTVSASLACQVMVTWPINWNTPRGDLTKRAYWHCAFMETGLHHELGLPPIGIIGLKDRVGIPSFNSPFCEADHRGNQSSHFGAYYVSQFALQRLCANLHCNINNSIANPDAPGSSNNDVRGPTPRSLKKWASELTQWRGMLPQDLQWAGDDPTGFPAPQPVTLEGFNGPLDPDVSPHPCHSSLPLFTTDLDSEPVQYPYVYDIQVALLRTRYYYAKYMVYRPFVHKALHFPQQMTEEDAEGVAECLQSCLKWPLTLSPTSRHKRLVPYLFCWSQNFLGILLIIHLTSHNPTLGDIRARLCGPRFEGEVEQTVEMMLDWIRDLKRTDPIAMWCWKILQGVYHLDP